MSVRPLSGVPKASLSKPGALLLTLPSPLDFPPNLYDMFYERFILCYVTLTPLALTELCLCHKDTSSLPAIIADSVYQSSSWLNSHHFYCYQPHPRHHPYLPERIQWSINQVSASASISISCVLSTVAKVILINESQVMSLCYYFRQGPYCFIFESLVFFIGT